jgi:RHS repeat-associated protein
MSRRYQIIVGTTTNTFLYDGWNLVSETIANPQSTITNSYVWGLDLSGSLQGAGGIGGLLSVTLSGAGVPPATYYPCADANGNITDYLDTNGTIVAHREFDAFGNTTVATGSMVNDFNFWFSTKYLDQETGLYYYGYRDFAPGMGRWLSRDPIEESGGVNIYQFVGNSALTWVDPVGLEWSDPERVGGIRARTTCEACDTVRELAEKVHLDAEEYLKWLQTEPPGGEMPSSADQPIVTSRTFTVPNRVYITYGNMRAAYAAGTLIGDPTDLSFYNKFLTRASGMESTFTSKGYRVTNFMGKLGIGGNPIGVHQGVLGKADIAVWGFFGHGKTPNGIFIGDTGAPGGPGVSGFSTAYNPAAFRGAQRYRLSEVVMFSCFQGSYALLPGWLDLVAKGGNLVASHLPVGIGWSGWTWFYNNPIFQHPKP